MVAHDSLALLLLTDILWDSPIEYLSYPQFCTVCSMPTVGRYYASVERVMPYGRSRSVVHIGDPCGCATAWLRGFRATPEVMLALVLTKEEA